MFFEGTLEEGITTALQQSKLVVCFVADDTEESQTWENDFLTDANVKSALKQHAVSLRLDAGSQEAGYLAAIFPLPKTPTLVVIRNGQLKEYITPGTSRNDFVRRLDSALSPTTASVAPTATAVSSQAAGPATVPGPATSTTTAASTAPPTATEPSPPLDAAAILARRNQAQMQELATEGERRRQLALQKEREAAAEAKRRRQEKGKMPEGATEVEERQQNPAVTKAAQELAKKKQAAREEKQRVLRLIEEDKIERKAKQEKAKAERLAKLGDGAIAQDTANETDKAASISSRSQPRTSDQCNLSVRLFDGTVIRTRLSSQSKLTDDVRPWVDEKLGKTSELYTFKVILSPLPNRTIDITEEHKTLQELELESSASLVISPVGSKVSNAYLPSAGPSGILNMPFALASSLIAGVVGVGSSVLGSVFPGAGVQESTQAAASDQPVSSSASRRREQQFYNGNSTNFQPRDDEEAREGRD